MVKNPPANAGDMGLIPGSGGSCGGEDWNHEKKMIKDYPYNIGEKYYQFADNPKAYARMVLRKDRMAVIRKTVMETGHRIKCYIRHDGH